jgi:hypothetical protein
MSQDVFSSIDLTPDGIDARLMPWLAVGVGTFYIVLI